MDYRHDFPDRREVHDPRTVRTPSDPLGSPVGFPNTENLSGRCSSPPFLSGSPNWSGRLLFLFLYLSPFVLFRSRPTRGVSLERSRNLSPIHPSLDGEGGPRLNRDVRGGSEEIWVSFGNPQSFGLRPWSSRDDGPTPEVRFLPKGEGVEKKKNSVS